LFSQKAVAAFPDCDLSRFELTSEIIETAIEQGPFSRDPPDIDAVALTGVRFGLSGILPKMG
jgi:hypothetical protein